MQALLFENDSGQRAVTLSTGPAGQPMQHLNGAGIAAVHELLGQVRRWVTQPTQLTLETPDV
jgi:hypothetical protein